MLTEEALAFAAENPPDESDVVEHLYTRRELYRSALHACSRSVYYSHLSDRVLDMYLSDTQIEPDVYTLSLVLTCCARTVDVDKAEAVWQSFTGEWGIQPDAVAFNSLLNVYARSQWNSTRRRKALYREVDPFELQKDEVQLEEAPDDEVTAVIERLGRLPPEAAAKGLRRALKEEERLEKKFASQIEGDSLFEDLEEDPGTEELMHADVEEGGQLLEFFGEDSEEDDGWIDMEDYEDFRHLEAREITAGNRAMEDSGGAHVGELSSWEAQGSSSKVALECDDTGVALEEHVEDEFPTKREEKKAELMDKLLASRRNVGLGTMAIEAALEPAHVLQQRNIAKAEWVVEEMTKSGIQPGEFMRPLEFGNVLTLAIVDAATLNNLCRVYALAHRINRAEEIVNNRFPSLGLQPDG